MGKGPGTSPPVPPLHLGISNIMAALDVGHAVDLVEFYSRVRNTEYNPRKFGGLIWRMTKPRVTCTFFKSGKIVINGAKSFEQSQQGATVVCKILRKLGIPIAPKPKYSISNINCYGDLGTKFNLDWFHESNIGGLTTEYNPEIFPGLTLRFEGTKTIMKLFWSGKFFFTGCKTTSEPLALFKLLLPVLQKFCKDKICESVV
jgi:transcription initiation factor TFIID TATA-box-binding protein